MGAVILAATALLAAPLPAGGGGELREPLLNIEHQLGGKIGPLSSGYELKVDARRRLFPASDHVLLKGARAQLGAVLVFTPATLYYGPELLVAPLTIFQLAVQAVHVNAGPLGRKYGLLDYTQLGQHADYSYAWRAEHGDEIGTKTSRIWAVFVKPLLQLKLGPVALVYKGTYLYWHPWAFEGLSYNFVADLVLSPESWALMHDALLLYQVADLARDGCDLLVGASNQIHQVLDDGGRTALQADWVWKAGLAVLWTVTDRWERVGIEKPSVVVLLHWFARDAIADPAAKRVFNATIGLRFQTPWRR